MSMQDTFKKVQDYCTSVDVMLKAIDLMQNALHNFLSQITWIKPKFVVKVDDVKFYFGESKSYIYYIRGNQEVTAPRSSRELGVKTNNGTEMTMDELYYVMVRLEKIYNLVQKNATDQFFVEMNKAIENLKECAVADLI